MTPRLLRALGAALLGLAAAGCYTSDAQLLPDSADPADRAFPARFKLRTTPPDPQIEAMVWTAAAGGATWRADDPQAPELRTERIDDDRFVVALAMGDAPSVEYGLLLRSWPRSYAVARPDPAALAANQAACAALEDPSPEQKRAAERLAETAERTAFFGAPSPSVAFDDVETLRLALRVDLICGGPPLPELTLPGGGTVTIEVIPLD